MTRLAAWCQEQPAELVADSVGDVEQARAMVAAINAWLDRFAEACGRSAHAQHEWRRPAAPV